MKGLLRYYFFLCKKEIFKPNFLVASSRRDAFKKITLDQKQSLFFLIPIPYAFIVCLSIFVSWFRLGVSKKASQRWWVKEMADLLGSGLNLISCIEATIYKTQNFLQKLLLCQLYHDVSSGASFSDAAHKNQLFTKLENVIIQSAEKNNCLRDAFLGIYEYLQYQVSYRSKQSIFIYPCIFMIMMTVLFSYYLANNVLNIYIYDLWLQGKRLSFFSSLFMSLYSGSFFRVIISVSLAFLGIKLFFYIVSFIKVGVIRQFMDIIILYLPIKRRTIRQREALTFFSSLLFTLKSGAPVHAAILHASFTIRHPVFRREVRDVYQKIYAGYPIDSCIQWLSFIDRGDQLTLMSCLSHYALDKKSLDDLTRYTFVRLENMQSMLVKLTNIFFGGLLCLFILFALSSAFSIIALDYV